MQLIKEHYYHIFENGLRVSTTRLSRDCYETMILDKYGFEYRISQEKTFEKALEHHKAYCKLVRNEIVKPRYERR